MKKNKIPAPRQTGEIFEEYAADFYAERGYAILFHSFQYKQYEIDLIVKKGDTVFFVEVKARNAKHQTDPLDRIDNKKMMNIFRCSEGFKQFLRQKHIATDELHFRYDGIGILYDDEKNVLQIDWEKDYYRPARHIYD